MAGDWIKFETNTPDKPEIWLIASALDIDPDAVVGKLLRIWGWFDQHTENGNAPSVTKMLLDRLVGVSGFCKCVIDAGWMHDKDGILSLANFERHNGQTAKTRALTAKRVQKHKAKAGNDEVTPTPLPREEKRRLKNISPDGDIGRPATQQRFIKPTLAELITEFTGRMANPEHQAQRFLAHYESNGWKVGRNPMKSWKAAVTNWITRSTEDANHNGKSPQHGLQHGSGSGKLSTVGRNNLAAERYLENLHREASEASGDHGAIVAEAG